jgi:hypothetical protein
MLGRSDAKPTFFQGLLLFSLSQHDLRLYPE